MVIWGKSKKNERRNINPRKIITHGWIKTQEIDSEVVGPRCDIVAERALPPLLRSCFSFLWCNSERQAEKLSTPEGIFYLNH
jgi:hypothetical protein